MYSIPIAIFELPDVFEYNDNEGGTYLDSDNYIITTTQNTSSNLDLKLYMPDMKVEDFFSVILKIRPTRSQAQHAARHP